MNRKETIKILSPCKDCQNRKAYGLCHDTCIDYKQFKEQVTNINKQRAQAGMFYDVQAKKHQRLRKIARHE